MNDSLLLIIILAVLAAAYFFYGNKGSDGQDYAVPEEYKGSQGLDYMRENYASQLAQARSLCTSQFKGSWIDSASEIGCHNMQGFSSAYCSLDIIQDLVNLCNSIGGNSVCSSTQTSCSV